MRGRAAIEACLAALPEMADFQLRTTRVDGRDDLAYVQGTYLMTIAQPDSSEPVQESGYFCSTAPPAGWSLADCHAHAHITQVTTYRSRRNARHLRSKSDRNQ